MAELSKEQPDNEAQSNQHRKSRKGLWLSLLMIFILLSLGGIIFYLDYLHKEHQQQLELKLANELNKKDQQVMELTEQISGYQTQIAAIQSQLANVQQDSSGKDQHFNQALDEFSKLHSEKLEITRTELKNSIDQVQRLLGKTRSDWLIADAEYLLGIANERLHLIGDIVAAKQALESADSRLRDSDDVAIFKVRDQIVKEIEALDNIKPLDIVGIYSKINALQQTVNQLTLFLPYVGKHETQTDTDKNTQTDASAHDHDHGHGWVDETLHKMKGYVSIRHSSKPIEGIIDHEEVQFILQQLKIRLELIKMALLQQNEALYNSSIDDAKQWLNENFTMNAQGKDFLKALEELQSIKIRSQLPVISESLKLLKDITKSRKDTDKTLPTLPAEPDKKTDTPKIEAAPSTPAVASEIKPEIKSEMTQESQTIPVPPVNTPADTSNPVQP